GDAHDSGVARSSRAGTKRSVKARPTRRGVPSRSGFGPRIQTLRKPFFSSTVVMVAVATLRSAARSSLSLDIGGCSPAVGAVRRAVRPILRQHLIRRKGTGWQRLPRGRRPREACENSPAASYGRRNEEPSMAIPRTPPTIAAVNGIATDTSFGAVTPPIYLSSNFAFGGLEQPRAHEYTRTSNPTRSMLADTLAQLEGGA